MSEVEGIYAVWLREFKVYLREKERVISSLISPILWLVAFGTGLGSVVTIEGVNYRTYIYPGILIMSVLFSSLFYGVYVIWDRKLDFLKEVLVAPLSRVSIFIGKVLGGCTTVMVQTAALLVIGYFIGFSLAPTILLEVFLLLFLLSIALVSLGLAIGANMRSPEGFMLVANFVIWPLFFFSGALFPLSNLPPWFSNITSINPVTYGVDLVRGAIIGIQHFPLLIDIEVIAIFSLLAIVAGTWSFKRMHG
ncbi:MAG: ABC transporter permease [Candidatus Hadarchaeum sp.]|uniref:ABC transporter permease n=1 Tax=Candidatus Hadarchaeum sp. TaxID=2883567 RepID=UPI003D11EB0D